MQEERHLSRFARPQGVGEFKGQGSLQVMDLVSIRLKQRKEKTQAHPS